MNALALFERTVATFMEIDDDELRSSLVQSLHSLCKFNNGAWKSEAQAKFMIQKISKDDSEGSDESKEAQWAKGELKKFGIEYDRRLHRVMTTMSRIEAFGKSTASKIRFTSFGFIVDGSGVILRARFKVLHKGENQFSIDYNTPSTLTFERPKDFTPVVTYDIPGSESLAKAAKAAKIKELEPIIDKIKTILGWEEIDILNSFIAQLKVGRQLTDSQLDVVNKFLDKNLKIDLDYGAWEKLLAEFESLLMPKVFSAWFQWKPEDEERITTNLEKWRKNRDREALENLKWDLDYGIRNVVKKEIPYPVRGGGQYNYEWVLKVEGAIAKAKKKKRVTKGELDVVKYFVMLVRELKKLPDATFTSLSAGGVPSEGHIRDTIKDRWKELVSSLPSDEVDKSGYDLKFKDASLAAINKSLTRLDFNYHLKRQDIKNLNAALAKHLPSAQPIPEAWIDALKLKEGVEAFEDAARTFLEKPMGITAFESAVTNFEATRSFEEAKKKAKSCKGHPGTFKGQDGLWCTAKDGRRLFYDPTGTTLIYPKIGDYTKGDGKGSAKTPEPKDTGKTAEPSGPSSSKDVLKVDLQGSFPGSGKYSATQVASGKEYRKDFLTGVDANYEKLIKGESPERVAEITKTYKKLLDTATKMDKATDWTKGRVGVEPAIKSGIDKESADDADALVAKPGSKPKTSDPIGAGKSKDADDMKSSKSTSDSMGTSKDDDDLGGTSPTSAKVKKTKLKGSEASVAKGEKARDEFLGTIDKNLRQLIKGATKAEHKEIMATYGKVMDYLAKQDKAGAWTQPGGPYQGVLDHLTYQQGADDDQREQEKNYFASLKSGQTPKKVKKSPKAKEEPKKEEPKVEPLPATDKKVIALKKKYNALKKKHTDMGSIDKGYKSTLQQLGDMEKELEKLGHKKKQSHDSYFECDQRSDREIMEQRILGQALVLFHEDVPRMEDETTEDEAPGKSLELKKFARTGVKEGTKRKIKDFAFQHGRDLYDKVVVVVSPVRGSDGKDGDQYRIIGFGHITGETKPDDVGYNFVFDDYKTALRVAKGARNTQQEYGTVVPHVRYGMPYDLYFRKKGQKTFRQVIDPEAE